MILPPPSSFILPCSADVQNVLGKDTLAMKPTTELRQLKIKCIACELAANCLTSVTSTSCELDGEVKQYGKFERIKRDIWFTNTDK